jgi:hypothetical protein
MSEDGDSRRRRGCRQRSGSGAGDRRCGRGGTRGRRRAGAGGRRSGGRSDDAATIQNRCERSVARDGNAPLVVRTPSVLPVVEHTGAVAVGLHNVSNATDQGERCRRVAARDGKPCQIEHYLAREGRASHVDGVHRQGWGERGG